MLWRVSPALAIPTLMASSKLSGDSALSSIVLATDGITFLLGVCRPATVNQVAESRDRGRLRAEGQAVVRPPPWPRRRRSARRTPPAHARPWRRWRRTTQRPATDGGGRSGGSPAPCALPARRPPRPAPAAAPPTWCAPGGRKTAPTTPRGRPHVGRCGGRRGRRCSRCPPRWDGTGRRGAGG